MAKVLGDIIGNTEGGQISAGHQDLLAYLDNIQQLGRVAVQIDNVGCLAGRLSTGVHGHRHICLSQRRGIICARRRSWPPCIRPPGIHGSAAVCPPAWPGPENRPPGPRQQWQRAVKGLSPVIMTVLMPITAQLQETLLDTGLDDVLQVDYPQDLRIAADDKRCGTCPGDPVHYVVQIIGNYFTAPVSVKRRSGNQRRLYGTVFQFMLTPEIRVSALKAISSASAASISCLRLYFCLAKTTTLRPSGVSSDSDAIRAASASSLFRMAPHRDKSYRLTVTEGNGAGLVQEQHIHVAGSFNGAARQGNDVFLRRACPCRQYLLPEEAPLW